MSKPAIDFYFDFISPYSYLSATQFISFEQQHGVSFNWLPVNLPRLIKLSGNTPPSLIKNKALYSFRDLKRWAAHLNVPFKMIRPGTFDSRPALRIAGALQGNQRAEFCITVFDAVWSGEINPTEDSCWLERIFESKQLQHTWLNQQNEDFEPNTHAALKAGAFGVPSFILHPPTGRSELFFGIDHMDFLARACDRLRDS